MTIRDILKELNFIDEKVDIELFDSHGLLFSFLEYDGKYLYDELGIDYNLDMKIDDYDLEYSPTHYKERVLYLYCSAENTILESKITNRERIMYELEQLSDRDFAWALEDAVCGYCSNCPSPLKQKCESKEDGNACFIFMGEWLSEPYDEKGDLIKIIY